jgi:hypothetical protein
LTLSPLHTQILYLLLQQPTGSDFDMTNRGWTPLKVKAVRSVFFRAATTFDAFLWDQITCEAFGLSGYGLVERRYFSAV